MLPPNTAYGMALALGTDVLSHDCVIAIINNNYIIFNIVRACHVVTHHVTRSE